MHVLVCSGNNTLVHYLVLALNITSKLLTQYKPNEALHAANLELIRYCARLTASGVPVIVTSRSIMSPSLFAILMVAPDIIRISCILAPFLPITQPINCKEMAKMIPMSRNRTQVHAQTAATVVIRILCA